MMQVSISISGDRQLQTKLKRLGSSLYEFRAGMNDIGRNVARYYSVQGFTSQGGVFGAKWSPLAMRTILQKSKTYPGRPPLVRTGAMQNSFTFTAASQQVLIGNEMPYFKYHQSSAPRSRLPRRQMMGVNAPVKRMVRTILEAEVRRKIMTVR